MSTDIDWQHELDSSFGRGHDVAPGHYVAAGRRAVRRRRATAVVLAAAVVVGGGAVWAVGPDDAVRGDAPVATEGVAPTPDETATATPDRDRRRPRATPSMSVEEEFAGNAAILDADGTLKVSPLAGRVLQRVDNPMRYSPAQGHSAAIRVIYQGAETYLLLAADTDGGLSTHVNTATGDFDGWLASKVALQQGLDGFTGAATDPASASGPPPDLLELEPGGAVVPAKGVVVLQQDTSPDLGPGFATPGSLTGAVRVLVDERPRFAAYRVVDGELEVIAAPGSFDSMSAFLRWARQQYASGEGMR
ncbi:hypothetical protein [Nocardioides pinisoli]|uniref:DUF2092 domain-containing protein n=1 Tax=Nocardioides pinisoli TaxID=2950279 RepID=A0ABT1KST4_9ACTN|nr:hypothetical protein [Nocardioides pinisoli]MCP3420808.1 hypothetical protein [Nocardioides pinisoli]